jgi:predicted DNA-binding transcriptional regulator YafY
MSNVADTSARMLRLLSLLQSRRDWGGTDLADRLGVSARTLRSDITRLRALGYPVEARPGVAGGYRLGSGAALPPLLLDDEEAVAVAVSLATSAGSSVTGVEDASMRALAKLRQVLPSRLRGRVAALGSSSLEVAPGGPTVDPQLLSELALACRDLVTLRFDYRSHDGTESRRTAEPYRLLHRRGRWYLFTFDVDRADWRVFRADRVTLRTPGGRRFHPRPLPDEDEIAARVSRGIDQAPWHYRARVVVDAPAEHVRSRLPVPVDVEPLTPDRCAVLVGSDDPMSLAMYLGLLGADFTVGDAPELRRALLALADRFRRAADG